MEINYKALLDNFSIDNRELEWANNQQKVNHRNNAR